MKTLTLVVAVIFAVSIALFAVSRTMAYEEPAYEVVDEREGYELRRYDSYVVAETEVEGGFEDAGNEAFRRLFGYISGNNRRAEKMEMTVPVTSAPSEKIAMTVPVISTTSTAEAGGSASYRYQFIMPSEYALDELPIPDDSRVSIREIPERYLAVHRYSGTTGEARYRRHEEILLEALERDGVAVAGEPVFARYDGPFTPWFLRRNEVMVEVSR